MLQRLKVDVVTPRAEIYGNGHTGARGLVGTCHYHHEDDGRGIQRTVEFGEVSASHSPGSESSIPSSFVQWDGPGGIRLLSWEMDGSVVGRKESFPEDAFRYCSGLKIDVSMAIESVLQFAHSLANGALGPGDVAVDATIGNGHDTVVLCQAVGNDGSVFGFDVQAAAIEETKRRLEGLSVTPDVDLFNVGHEQMAEHLPPDVRGSVGAITFNLGYLPGSDSSLTTGPETTIPALRAAVDVLRPGGVVTVVMYTGHEGGPDEAEAVDRWARALSQEDAHALSYQFVNQKNDPPRLVAIEKRR